MKSLPLTITAVFLVCCSDQSISHVDDDDDDAGSNTDTDTDTDIDTDTDTDTDTGSWEPPQNSLVYANTETNLYYVDPSTGGTLELVGPFSGPCTTGSGFYDIAISGDGDMVGISAEGLYTVDTDTAACSLLCDFPTGSPHFFSLSYVKGVDPQDPGEEKLVAASVEEGEWVLVDPTGQTIPEIFIHLGYHDPPDYDFVSSGDVVSIQVGAAEHKTYATLKCAAGYGQSGCESDWLAQIDPETGAATMIGSTGFIQIFGLGFWGDQIYGFTGENEYITIDVNTGLGTEVESYVDIDFWGAGTTTNPHVIIE